MSFPFAAAMTLVAILTLLIWSVVDASFGDLIDYTLISLRLRSSWGFNLTPSRAWGKLGARMVLLAALLCLGLISIVLVLGASLATSPEHLWKWHAIAASVLSIGWLGAVLYCERLSELAFPIRVRWRLSRFTRLAEHLAAHWPVSDCDFPDVGEYTMDADYPWMLTARQGLMYPFWETGGMFIRNGAKDVVRFDLRSHPEWKLEYIPSGEGPASFDDVFSEFSIHYELTQSRQLAPSMFLTRYEPGGLFDVSEQGGEQIRQVASKLTESLRPSK
jgi:hypothetical protein